MRSLPARFGLQIANDAKLLRVIARGLASGTIDYYDVPKSVRRRLFLDTTLFRWIEEKAREGNSRLVNIMTSEEQGVERLHAWSEELRAGSIAPESVTPDNAAKGGIDFNEDLLDLQIRRDDKGLPLPMTLQDPGILNIKGLVPVIQDVRPFVLSVGTD